MPNSGIQKFCSKKCRREYEAIYQQKRKSRPKKKCEICGRDFVPRIRKQVTCSRKKCQKERYKRASIRKAEAKCKLDFSKGTVYVLDEETWQWKKEIRS